LTPERTPLPQFQRAEFAAVEGGGARNFLPRHSGRAKREPGIHRASVRAAKWIPGLRLSAIPE